MFNKPGCFKKDGIEYAYSEVQEAHLNDFKHICPDCKTEMVFIGPEWKVRTNKKIRKAGFKLKKTSYPVFQCPKCKLVWAVEEVLIKRPEDSEPKTYTAVVSE